MSPGGLEVANSPRSQDGPDGRPPYFYHRRFEPKRIGLEVWMDFARLAVTEKIELNWKPRRHPRFSRVCAPGAPEPWPLLLTLKQVNPALLAERQGRGNSLATFSNLWGVPRHLPNAFG